MSNIFTNFAQHSLAFRKQEIIVFVKEDHNGRRLLFALKMINLSYNYRQFMAMVRIIPCALLLFSCWWFSHHPVCSWWWMLYHHYRDLRDKWAFPCTTTTQHHRSMHHWTTEWMGSALAKLFLLFNQAQAQLSRLLRRPRHLISPGIVQLYCCALDYTHLLCTFLRIRFRTLLTRIATDHNSFVIPD